MLEHEHRLAQPQTVRERAAYRKRLDVEGLGAGHELAGGKHLAQRVHGMHGIHHLLGLGGKRAIVLEDVQADLPAICRPTAGPSTVMNTSPGASMLPLGSASATVQPKRPKMRAASSVPQSRPRRACSIPCGPAAADAQDMRGQVDPAWGCRGSDKLIEIAVPGYTYGSSLRFLARGFPS